MIYLDYAANTPADPAVLARFVETEGQYIGNPNSKHNAGKAANSALETVTAAIAEKLNVKSCEIIYTSGASEANNLAIKGIARSSRHIGKHIISTPLEHMSVSAPLTYLQEQGYEIDLVDIGRDGVIDVEHFRELLREDTVLAAVCAVDSELGTVQPIREIAEILRDYPNCKFHVDMTQAVGKTDIILEGVDTAAFSAHKFYGLNGSGLLFKKESLVIEPLFHGGVSSSLYRSGTPTLALGAALDMALELTLAEREKHVKAVQIHNAFLRGALSSYTGVYINSPENAVPHILNVSVKDVKGGEFQKALDKHGVCVSVKSACSVEGTPSRAVFAISRDKKIALSSWRISLSHLTTKEEMKEFMTIFDKCYKELVNG